MHESIKFPCVLFISSVLSDSFMLPKQQQNMITIVTSINTTSQLTIDSLSSSMYGSSLSPNYDNWLVYNVHKMDFSFKLKDLDDAKVKINISTKYFRFTTKFIKLRNKIFILYTDNYEETQIAIRNSGFGTSSNAIFMLMITKGIQNSKYLLKPFEEGLAETDVKKEPFNAILALIVNYDAKTTKVGIMCHTCLISKIRYFETTTQQTNLELLKKLSNQLNNNGNKRKVPVRGPLAVTDPTLMPCFQTLNQPASRALELHLQTYCGLGFAIWFPLYRHLNVTMTLPTHLQTLEEHQISRWWFNFAFGETAYFTVPNQFAKTRGIHSMVSSSPMTMFVCLDTEQLRKVNLLIFNVLEPEVWGFTFIFALLLILIYKNLKQGWNFVSAIIGFSVSSLQRKHFVYFFLWANFVALGWQSTLSADILSIQDFPDMSTLVQKTWRIWINKPNYLGVLQLAAGVFGRNFWHGKTIDEMIHDASVDPVPWTDGVAIVKKIKTSKRGIFMFRERSFESAIWKKANFVDRRTVCKTILYNSGIRRELEFGMRIWGLEYAQIIFQRFVENGFHIHHISLFHRGSRLFHGKPLTLVEGFSLPEPLSLKSAVGVCFLGVLIVHTTLFIFGLIFHRRSVKSWITRKCQVTKVKPMFSSKATDKDSKTCTQILRNAKVIIKRSINRFRLRCN